MILGEIKYYMATETALKIKKTLEAAENDCIEYLQNNPRCNERYIVQIIKVVKRDHPPVLIEDIE